MAKKTNYKEERLRERRERERKIGISVPTVQMFCALAKIKRAVRYALFRLQFSSSAIFMLINQRPVKIRRTGEKCGFFFATLRPSPKGQRVKESYQFVSN